ncbi:outer membrane beta-barrel protein [Avrilella dinanensis]|uniref:outer membrane beta-barrel protein n=1 Tax=Avrilella dinanensis TaxID=2008672 RepID=UPI002409490D|nr:outer membrane beta-barrel protein [Avrilella dinanensis]
MMMKNKFFFSICFCFITTIFHGQSVRVVSGLNWSSLKSSTEFNILDSKVKTFSIGLATDLYTEEKFTVSSELSYFQLGGREKNPLIESWEDYSKKWSYLSFNSTFRYKIISDKQGYVFLGVGPQLNLNIDSGKFDDTLYEGNFKMKTINLGAVLEGGYLRDLTSKVQIGVLAKYMYPITSFSTNEFVNFSFYPYSINLMLGYKL